MDVLFDLDGTLTDPELGITRCIEHALATMGRPSPPREQLRRYIGPPLRDSFVELLGSDDDRADEALRHYRDRFSAFGLYENAVYPEVPGGLETLRARGHRLWVATSKPHLYACRIVAHFGLERFFEGVYGSELSGVLADKASLIRHVIEREHLTAPRVWMVGDRMHDIVGGRANGTRTIGVLWGYGDEAELAAAGADVLAGSMAAVIEAIDRAA